MKNKKLKAFLVSYSYAKTKEQFKQGHGHIRNILVCARIQEEAVEKLEKHLFVNLGYESETITILAVQRMRKTSDNAYYFTQEYYNKQNYFIEHFDLIKKEGKQ